MPPVTDEQIATLMGVITPDMCMTPDEQRIRLANVETFRTAVAQVIYEIRLPIDSNYEIKTTFQKTLIVLVNF